MLPIHVLLVGATVGILLLGIVFLLVTARRRTLALAENMTRELKSSEQFLQGTLDSLSAHIAILDENGVILSVNRAWREFAEENNLQDPSFSVGSNYLKICESAHGKNSASAKELAKGIRLVLAHQNYEFNLEYPCHSPAEMRWFVVRITRFESTKSMRLVVAHENITNRKLAEQSLKQSEEHFRALIENSLDVVTIIDADRIIRYQSAAVKRVLGYEPDELIGKSAFELVHPEDQVKVINAISKAIENPAYSASVIYRFLHKNGSWRVLQGAGKNLLNDPIVKGLVINSMDITERRAEEEARFQLANEARDAALDASKAKSDFLATMSHEIRTPMNAIIGMADLLEETSLNPEQQEYVRIFKRAGDTLLNLINDILDLAKVESGNLELEDVAFDLQDMMERTVELMAIRAHEKGLELSCHLAPGTPKELIGDSHRLRQVVMNLVGNAIKFTEQGEVVIEVKNQADAPDQKNPKGKRNLLFSVRDTGVGISKGKMTSIFDSFVQADSSTTRKYGGSGLGLSITKRLVELMDGKIWVESSEGRGSTFFITLSFEIPRKTEMPGGTEERTASLKNLRVLIVDDNATNRLILKEYMSSIGALVSEASNADDGIRELKNAKDLRKPYELLLLDCRMPGKDGFQMAEEIKENLGLADTVIMMLTSESRYGDIAQSRKLGLSGYIVKPIKRGDLINTILVGMSRTQTKTEPVSPANSGSFARPLNILFVEDSLDNRLLVKAYFKNHPFTLEDAFNGEEAFEKFKKQTYDIVLMDIQMPVMDGYTATREIRKWESDHGLKPTPIVALTAHAFREDAQKCLEAGFTSYVTKPIKKTKLLEVISNLTKYPEVRKEAA